MPPHKFKVGQDVYYHPAKFRVPAASQKYKILRRLPSEHGDVTYRIKNTAEQFERVAKESELSVTDPRNEASFVSGDIG